MFTVFIKLYISDKCNKDWLTSNALQHSKAVKELKQLAQEFDRNLHFAVIPSSTVERGESFAEVLYEGDMPDDLQVNIESTARLLSQDATQQTEGIRFVLKLVDTNLDIMYVPLK